MRKKIIVSILVIGLLYFFFLRKKKNTNTTTNNTDSVAGTNQTGAKEPEPEKVLKRGSTGYQVKELQKALNYHNDGIDFMEGYQDTSVDGSFGPDTERLLFNLTGLRMIALTGPNNTFNPVLISVNYNPQL